MKLKQKSISYVIDGGSYVLHLFAALYIRRFFYVNTFLQRAHTLFPKHKNKCINFDGDLMYSFSFLSSSTEIAQICTMK